MRRTFTESAFNFGPSGEIFRTPVYEIVGKEAKD